MPVGAETLRGGATDLHVAAPGRGFGPYVLSGPGRFPAGSSSGSSASLVRAASEGSKCGSPVTVTASLNVTVTPIFLPAP